MDSVRDLEHAQDHQQDHQPTAATGRTWVLRVAAVAVAICMLIWVTAVVLCVNRGLDTTDESFYLLSYRWWDVNFDNFTGAQYFYGPIFEAIGYNIAGLRGVRLLVLLGTHAVFAWQFMGWLRLQRPASNPSRWWELAGAAAIVTCSAITYSWLPLSPGYNDLALTCTVLAAGLTIRIARDAQTSGLPRWWAPAVLGVVAVVLTLTKWSSAMLVLACIVAALLIVVGALGLRRLAILVGQGAAGSLVALAFINFVLVPFSTLLPPMLKVNSLVAGSTNSPSRLLQYYFDQAMLVVNGIIDQQWPVLIAAVLALASRRLPRTTLVVAVLAVGVGVWRVIDAGGVRAASTNLPALSVTVFTPLVVVAVVGLVSALLVPRSTGSLRTGWPERIRRWTIYGLLLALPVAQAAGTGNPVHYLAMMGLALWMALVIAVLTALPRDLHAPRVLVAGAATSLIVCTMLVAVDGVWNKPYRTTGHAASTTHAIDVPALSSLRFAPETASDYHQLRETVRPYAEKPGRAMIGFDALPGLVLAVGGRPVGEAWISSGPSERSVANIRRACADGSPWWGDREPIMIARGNLIPQMRRALRECGLVLERDYTRIRMKVSQVPIIVYLPRQEDQ